MAVNPDIFYAFFIEFLIKQTIQVTSKSKKTLGLIPMFFSYSCLSRANFNPNPIKTSPVALSIILCTFGDISHSRK